MIIGIAIAGVLLILLVWRYSSWIRRGFCCHSRSKSSNDTKQQERSGGYYDRDEVAYTAFQDHEAEADNGDDYDRDISDSRSQRENDVY